MAYIIKVSYGIEDKWIESSIDIFRIYNTRYYVPAGDYDRWLLIKNDPFPGKEKYIKLTINGKTINLSIGQSLVINSDGTYFDPVEKLSLIHKEISIDFGSLNEELPEQMMAAIFIDPKDRILEIGGNIGRNSCILSKLVNDDRNLVVMESNNGIAKQLEHNRNKNRLRFSIIDNALSRYQLYQKGWNTSDKKFDEEWRPIKCMTYQDLKLIFPIDFNVLVLDCEGAFGQILDDFPQIINTINKIIIENDGSRRRYEKMSQILYHYGFNKTFSRPLSKDNMMYGKLECSDFFYEVFTR